MKRNAIIRFNAVLCFLFVPAIANAQWIRLNSPISGQIVTVGNILLLTDDESMFRSTDSGITWEPVDSMPSPVCEWGNLLAHNTDVYLTTDYCGIFHSIDSGKSWMDYANGLSYVYENQPIAIGDSIYMDMPGGWGLWESSDKVANWHSMENYQPSCHFGGDTSAYCWTLDSNYLFAGATPFGGIYRSQDSAVTWDQVFPLSYDTGIFALTANGRFIVAVASVNFGVHNIGLYRSTDWGTSWYAENNALNGRFIRTLATYNNIMFAGGNFGVFISQDNGATWTDANEDSTNGTIISFTSLGPYVYASGGGNTWRRLFSDFNGGAYVNPPSEVVEPSGILEIYDLLGRSIYSGPASSKPRLSSAFYFERTDGNVRKIWVP